MNDASEITHLVSALNELDKKINKITSSMNKMKLSQTTSLVEKIRKQIASFDFSSLDKGVEKINKVTEGLNSFTEQLKNSPLMALKNFTEELSNNITSFQKMAENMKNVSAQFQNLKKYLGLSNSDSDKKDESKNNSGTQGNNTQNISSQLENVKNGLTNLANDPSAEAIAEKCTNITTSFSQMSLSSVVSIGAVALIVAAVIGAVVQLWNTNEEFRNSVMLAWENIQAVLLSAYENVLKPLFDSLVSLCISVWENGLRPLWNEFVNLVDVVMSALLDFWNFVSPYITQLLEFLGPILKDAFDFLGTFIGNTLNGVLGIITTVIGAATGVFKGVIDFISGVFSTDWSQAWENVKQIFSGIWETLSGIVSGVWNTILGLFANGGKIFSGVVDGISGAFKNIVNSIIRGINDVIRVPFNKVNGLLNSIRSFNIPLIGQPFLGLWSYNPLPIPVIPTLARGGFANVGQLFIANEPGNPELIGNIGGRTAVVNNQMILDGIQSAMRNAIIEGMSLSYGQNRQGDTYVDVYIDGVFTERKLMKANERHMLRTGKPVFAKG